MTDIRERAREAYEAEFFPIGCADLQMVPDDVRQQAGINAVLALAFSEAASWHDDCAESLLKAADTAQSVRHLATAEKYREDAARHVQCAAHFRTKAKEMKDNG